MNTTTKTAELIRQRIKAMPIGEPFAPTAFLECGTRASVDQTISRLVKAGSIERVTRGVLVRPEVSRFVGKISPSPLKVAETFMELEALAPGRIDLGLGRALGADGVTGAALVIHPIFVGVLSIGIFLTKVLFFIFVFMWVRWTIPRFRYDQLMNLGWKILIPLALFNMLVTGAFILLQQNNWHF